MRIKNEISHEKTEYSFDTSNNVVILSFFSIRLC